MTIELKFADLMGLATGSLEKDGVTITVNRPVIAEIKADSIAKTGRVVFYLDEADERRRAEI